MPIIADWLLTLPKPIGLMACNDDRGEWVGEACKIAGLSVPDEIAIIGKGRGCVFSWGRSERNVR